MGFVENVVLCELNIVGMRYEKLIVRIKEFELLAHLCEIEIVEIKIQFSTRAV